MLNRGFVAFTILITVTCFIIIFQYINSLGIIHFFDQVQRKQYREIAFYNAYSCIDQALLSLSQDYFFLLSSVLKFDELNCSILSVTKDVNSQNIRIIEAKGNFKNIIIKRVAIAKLYDDHLELISIE
jgi:hypothetical protein